MGLKPLPFLFGLLAGVVVGSTAALLTAPRSGRETRGSLSREAKRMAVRATGLHPNEWRDISAEDDGRHLVDNLERIRSAGF